MLTFLALVSVGAAESYTATMCSESDYINAWDGHHDASKDYYFFNGQMSEHDNGKEDRRFKWRYCRPTDNILISLIVPSHNNPFGNSWSFPETLLDDEWRRGCGGNAGITKAESDHDNPKEDRVWKFQCHELDQNQYRLTGCGWTDYKNDYDKDVDYKCPYNGVMRGIESIHSNNAKDRRWKFECCRIQDNIYEFPDMSCVEDQEYENDYDGDHPDNTRSGYFLNGQQSTHDNHYEDRRFKWRYCKPTSATSAVKEMNDLTITEYDAEWERSCDNFADGNAAIIGGLSAHDNNREDRQWTFKCGTLDTSRYRLVTCGYTGYLSNWDADINFNCPHDGVIRSIWSKHDNGREDRLWKFECCTIAKVNYKFDTIIGVWDEIISCIGCPGYDYTVSVGIEQTSVETVSSEYTSSLEVSIATGFEFFSVGTGITVTDSVSQTTATSMEDTLSITESTTLTIECDKKYLYQWRTNAVVSINDIVSGDVSVHVKGHYICTDIQNPQCPLGACASDDCQSCTDAFMESRAEDTYEYRFKPMMNIILISFMTPICVALTLYSLALVFCIKKEREKKIFYDLAVDESFDDDTDVENN